MFKLAGMLRTLKRYPSELPWTSAGSLLIQLLKLRAKCSGSSLKAQTSNHENSWNVMQYVMYMCVCNIYIYMYYTYYIDILYIHIIYIHTHHYNVIKLSASLGVPTPWLQSRRLGRMEKHSRKRMKTAPICSQSNGNQWNLPRSVIRCFNMFKPSTRLSWTYRRRCPKAKVAGKAVQGTMGVENASKPEMRNGASQGQKKQHWPR